MGHTEDVERSPGRAELLRSSLSSQRRRAEGGDDQQFLAVVCALLASPREAAVFAQARTLARRTYLNEHTVFTLDD